MKKLIIFCTLFATFLSGTVYADDFQASAKHAIAVEVETGRILYEKDASSVDGIASITKLLTAYLVYEAIDKGEISLDSPVDISDGPYNLTVNSNASNVPLEARRYSVKQLLEASLIASANSASIALAEKVAGSEVAFVERMKNTLLKWGITDATIINVTGLNSGILDENLADDQKVTENKMSAKDIAILTRHLIQDYPQVLDITKKPSFELDGQVIASYNYMLEGFPYYRSGVDGLKTGTSEVSGASFVATTTEQGIRIITVILGADQADDNTLARFEATNQLMNYVYQHYQVTKVLEKGKSYKHSSVPIINGNTSTLSAVATKDVSLLSKTSEKDSLTLQFTPSQKTMEAPIQKDQEVGVLHLKDSKANYLDDTEMTVKMIAKNDVQRAFFLTVWWNEFVRFVNEKL